MNTGRYNLSSYAKSLANGANDRNAHPKCWVAALVRMNCEKKAPSKLDKAGITNYAPIQQEEHQWSECKKKINRVVIPMVVFVRLAQNEADEIRRLPFILKFITYPGSRELATPIPDEQIDKLKLLLHNVDAKVTIVENLKVGDKVRLVGGPMKGLEGELSHIEENKPVVAITIDGLGYACISIDKLNLELI